MNKDEDAPSLPNESGRHGKINLFVYGSLMYEPVWRPLAAASLRRKPARLSGYRRLRIRNEDYPGLVQGVGTVAGIVWLDVDGETLERLDRFEAECYERVRGVVVDDTGTEIVAHYYEIKESHRAIVEDVEWDPREFEAGGMERFIRGYAGFAEQEAQGGEAKEPHLPSRRGGTVP